MIDAQYPEPSWTQAYTDGSATNAAENRGAGIYMYIMDRSGYREEAHFHTEKHCTNYDAELQALVHAAHTISTREENCLHVVFLTNALSAIQALENNKLDGISEAPHPISSINQVMLQWIPAHCGIPGNENADRLAKLSAAREQEYNWVTHEEMKSHIKSLYRPRKQTNDYYLLSR
ncbi:ribonuclease H-like [Gigantopelta aegis]|uniref:ribonuclease H-like n=1 Tax=Gigantopelta aegis TaxID=1735272 RepID=UPI001B88BDF2|nr:ribonuclease H-like [Gigantopelta aegis]